MISTDEFGAMFILKKSLLCCLAIVLIASSFVFQANAGTQEQLAECAAIQDENKRLRCYDSFFDNRVVGKGGVTYLRVRKDMKTKWVTTTEDRPGGGKNVYIHIKSLDLWVRADSQLTSSDFSDLRPSFWIQCENGRTAAFMDLGIFLELPWIEATIRIDDQPNYKRVLKADATGRRFGQWDEEIIVENLKATLDAERLTVKFSQVNNSSLVTRFSLNGMDKALIPLREACGW